MSPRYWTWLEDGEVMESSLLLSTTAVLALNLPLNFRQKKWCFYCCAEGEKHREDRSVSELVSL